MANSDQLRDKYEYHKNRSIDGKTGAIVFTSVAVVSLISGIHYFQAPAIVLTTKQSELHSPLPGRLSEVFWDWSVSETTNDITRKRKKLKQNWKEETSR
jgi:hypothetical protein